MNWIDMIFLFVVGLLLLDSFVIVPATYYAHTTILGKRRWGRRMQEGPNFKIPIIERIGRIFSMQLHTDALGPGVGMNGSSIGIELAARAEDAPPEGSKEAEGKTNWEIRKELASKGRLSLTFKGSAQYRPSFRNLTTFYEMEVETIDVGLIDAISSTLAEITAIYSAERIIEMKRYVSLMIDCILRLEVAPHHPRANAHYGWEEGDEEYWEVGELEVEGRLEAYRKHESSVLELLECCEGSSSRVERRYGIEIETVAISDLDFSKGTKEALEKARQVRAEAEAERARKKEFMDYVRQFMEPPKDDGSGGLGMSLEEAQLAAKQLLKMATPEKLNRVKGGAVPVLHMNQDPE